MNLKIILLTVIPIVALIIGLPIMIDASDNIGKNDKLLDKTHIEFEKRLSDELDRCETIDSASCVSLISTMYDSCSSMKNPPICSDQRINQYLP